ncbi:T9SS type A sorting domain-containing protein [Riemerella columbipharyngis]|uniref:Por secretion system C-terminal sorting domain-containing protein n=1 Tax=Riemerella columbipharyngis TaxID=1071918 RepID=A0A1G7A3U2_9FLAO|nr:T9SS type A sorting domain-containing protein [Riemerella columbipharyngis]SDE09303.1 Por secretion system C-terminal sorting domain-containing protein [Riemerella columbipharyngis]
MKKIYSLIAISAMTATMSAQQANAFTGSDFENWDEFVEALRENKALKEVKQGVGTGVNGTNSLNFTTEKQLKKNLYLFSVLGGKGSPINAETADKLTFMIKGKTTGKSLSINVYTADDETYKAFNLGDLEGEDKNLSSSEKNNYNGTIDTKGKWVKVTLDISGIEGINFSDNSRNFFGIKVGKSADYNIDIDDIKLEGGKLGVYELTSKTANLVKNTVVSDKLVFGAKSNVVIFNANGQAVKSAQVSEGSVLDLSSLPKGVYIVSGSVNNKSVSQKIVKK